MKHAIPGLLLAVLLAAAVSPAAQDAPRERRPPDEVFRLVDTYFLGALQQRLELSDEQLTRLLPRVRRLQSDRRALVQRRMRALQELRRLLMSGTATEGRVEELLREVKAVEAEEPVTVRRDMEAIDAVLSPVQQAKYRLLEVEVERRIRQAMARARARGRPGPRGREPEEPPPPR